MPDWLNAFWGPSITNHEGAKYDKLQLLSVDVAWALEVPMTKFSCNVVVKHGPTTRTRTGVVKDVPIKCANIYISKHKEISQCVFRWQAGTAMMADANDQTYES